MKTEESEVVMIVGRSSSVLVSSKEATQLLGTQIAKVA